MFNYSSATIEGRATRAADKRYTKTGKAVCHFSIAVNHYSKENSEAKVSYIDVETWDKLAEICGDQVTKGKWVMVIGELRQERWTGDDGKVRSKLKLLANEVRYLASYNSKGENSEDINIESSIAV